MRRVLSAALGDRFRALLAGIGVTAVLQSSTATGLMAASFAAGGMVDLVPALAVMLGANFGTTLIVQILSFNITAAAPVLFGQEFKQNDTFQLWGLHVWLWKENPSGLFASWNPRVSCRHTTAVSSMAH